MPGEATSEIPRSAEGVTVEVTGAELFEELGSIDGLETVAVFVTIVAAPPVIAAPEGTTRIVSFAVEPLGRLPSTAVTKPVVAE